MWDNSTNRDHVLAEKRKHWFTVGKDNWWTGLAENFRFAPCRKRQRLMDGTRGKTQTLVHSTKRQGLMGGTRGKLSNTSSQFGISVRVGCTWLRSQSPKLGFIFWQSHLRLPLLGRRESWITRRKPTMNASSLQSFYCSVYIYTNMNASSLQSSFYMNMNASSLQSCYCNVWHECFIPAVLLL